MTGTREAKEPETVVSPSSNVPSFYTETQKRSRARFPRQQREFDPGQERPGRLSEQEIE